VQTLSSNVAATIVSLPDFKPTVCQKRALPSDAEVMINGRMEPLLIEGGQRVKSLSIGFLADFEEAWQKHGKKVLEILAEKYPQAFFGGAVALAKTVKWDQAETEMFDKTLSPEEIMDKLEQRVGPEGRKLFERFLRDVNELGARRHLEAQARTGVTERSGKRGPV
jgi:hypothetical protein